MRCRTAQRLLSLYLDGGPCQRRTRRLEMHLSGCPQCRERLAHMRDIAAAMRELPRAAAPEGFRAALRRRLASLSGRTPARERKRSFRTGIAAALAAALVTLTLFFSIYPAYRVPRIVVVRSKALPPMTRGKQDKAAPKATPSAQTPQTVEELVRSAGGAVDRDRVSKTQKVLTVRIPTETVQDFLEGLGAFGAAEIPALPEKQLEEQEIRLRIISLF